MGTNPPRQGYVGNKSHPVLQCPILLGAGYIYKLKTGKMPFLNLWRTLADDFRTVYREKVQNYAANWNWALPMVA